MRDVSVLEHVPTREEIRARIPNPERFQPAPRLLVQPTLTLREDGTGDLLLPRRGKTKHIHQLHVEVVRAFAEGGGIPEAVARALPATPLKIASKCEKLVRRFLWMLHKEGIVEIPLEPPPAVFDGRYRHIREIGRGGMGVVHLCADEEREGAPVVVKHAWGWSKPVERADRNVRQEARAMARLQHPRIPGIVDFFEVDGLLHIVRDFAAGEPLQSSRHREALRDPAARLATLRECARMLGYIHERGMLYMDVKPDNFVMDTVEKGPYLIDLGLCCDITGDVIKLRGAIGSPGLAAPEVVRRHEASVRSDVFGLGRSFTALAIGKPLRPKHHEPEVLAALEAAGVSGVEREVLARMCADDPARRFPNMAAVVDAIP